MVLEQYTPLNRHENERGLKLLRRANCNARIRKVDRNLFANQDGGNKYPRAKHQVRLGKAGSGGRLALGCAMQKIWLELAVIQASMKCFCQSMFVDPRAGTTTQWPFTPFDEGGISSSPGKDTDHEECVERRRD